VSQHGTDDFDALVLQSVVLPGSPGPDEVAVRKRFRRLADAVRDSAVPVVLQTGVTFSLSSFALELVQENDLTVMPGIAAGMRAVERAARYGELRARSPRTLPSVAVLRDGAAARRSDRDVETVLRTAGVPVPPTRLVTSADDAVRAAAELGHPVVLKAVSQQIAHKSDVGGVELDLRDDRDVARAFERIVASVRAAAPDAVLDGVSVTPMRPPGAELIVSVANDPTWGPVLTVGSGGVLAELVADVAVRVGAVTTEEVLGALSELRMARVLAGFRGAPPADLPAVAAAVLALVRAADDLGPSLRVLEVNPLWVLGERVECLDVLVEWRED
jgi:acyl-CoA synthetase (NDP forming)